MANQALLQHCHGTDDTDCLQKKISNERAEHSWESYNGPGQSSMRGYHHYHDIFYARGKVQGCANICLEDTLMMGSIGLIGLICLDPYACGAMKGWVICHYIPECRDSREVASMSDIFDFTPCRTRKWTKVLKHMLRSSTRSSYPDLDFQMLL